MNVIIHSSSGADVQNNSTANETLLTPKIEHVTEVCRLCGEENDNCIPIFEDKLSIAEKISRCLPIMVFANDELPSHICKRCLTYLNISYKLIINSVKVDAQLRQKLQQKKDNVVMNSHEIAKQKSSTSKDVTTPAMSIKKLKKLAIHGPVTCEFCNLKFLDVNSFDRHFVDKHLLKWKCNFCDGSFQTSSELIKHKTVCHAGNIIICKTCVDEGIVGQLALKDTKTELEDMSSGEECEEKFYIPAEPPKETVVTDTTKSVNLNVNEPSTLSDSFNLEGNDSVPTNVDVSKSSTKEITEQTKYVGPDGLYYFCKVCHLNVNDKKLFEFHQKIHLPRTMICVLCKKESPTIYDLYQHKKEAHNLYSKVNLKYVCDTCGKFFSNNWQWDDHKKRKCRNKIGDNKCKYCDSTFSTSHKLKKHLRKHKQEMFSDPTVEVFKCVTCPKIFVDEEFYQKHRNVHDPECWNNFKCTICNRSFRDSVRLREHMKSIHEGYKPHACDVCGKAFIRLSNMKVHRALHFGHKCTHCDQTFDKVRLLVNHIQQDHGKEPPASLLNKKGYVSGTHMCKYCGRTLATYQSLLDHEHIHTGEKPYPCSICDKSFRSYTARWSHLQRHKEGNFICEHCGKNFSYKQNLLTHIQIHTSVEERKHQCPTCNKKFLRKAHLVVHMRIHEGLRPYTCDICNFSFTQIGDMRRHRARHANGEVLKRQPRKKVEHLEWVSENEGNEDTN